MVKLSERRLAENEVIFRTFNEDAKDFILEAAQDPAIASKPLRFYCECSSMRCLERIELTAEEYDRLHQNRRRFTLKPGHEMLHVERVVTTTPEFIVVEKVVEPPTPTDEIRPADFV